MRKVSPKRARQNRERAAMIDRLYPGRIAPCAIRVPVPGICTGWADDIHEPLTRGRGGSITDEDNQVPGCRPCHTYITDTPESQLGWAYERGLLKHSRPVDKPWEVTA